MKKNILFITPYTPSRLAAGENFTKQVLAHFPDDYAVDLVYFSTRKNVYEDVPDNVSVVYCCSVGRFSRLRMVLRQPWLFPLFSVRYSPEVVRLLRRLDREKHYDLIYCDHAQTYIYGTLFPDRPKILMAHDVEVQRYSRRKIPFAASWCAWTECRLMRMPHAHILVFSEKDQRIVQEQYGLHSETVDFYLESMISKTELHCTEDAAYVFFANWSRPENTEGLAWFLKRVVPRLPPGLAISVIGSGLSRPLQDELEKNGYRYWGFVADPYPLIANARALLAPIFHGAGVKVKVIEALACGTEVLGTSVAFEGIPERYESFLHFCEDAESFADQIVRFHFSWERKLKLRELSSTAHRVYPVDIIRSLHK